MGKRKSKNQKSQPRDRPSIRVLKLNTTPEENFLTLKQIGQKVFLNRHCMALEEVHPETLDYLRPLLRRTLDTGETVQLPHTAWFLHAQTRDGRLFVHRCGGA